MAAAWPAGLPQLPLEGYQVSAEPNVIASSTGAGPTKLRRRSTKERVHCSTDVEWTGAEVAIFEAFWLTIDQGALPFTWVDFITGATVDYQFTRKPQFTQVFGGSSTNTRFYKATLELERL